MENLNNKEQNPSEVLNKIYSTLQDIKNAAYKKDETFEALHDRIIDKAEELQKKYPDYREYKMYHLLISSTPDGSKPCNKFDFPEKDSVANFIRSL